MSPTLPDPDDYMSMTFTTTPSNSNRPTKTSLQRRVQATRQAHERSRTKSKAEIAAAAAKARDQGLRRNILLPDEQDPTSTIPVSKGVKMMQQMGYKLGETLGRPNKRARSTSPSPFPSQSPSSHLPDPTRPPGLRPKALQEPIEIHIRQNRAGIGIDLGPKPLLVENTSALMPETTEQYRTRVTIERQNGRAEAQWRAAMRILADIEGAAETTVSSRFYAPLLREREHEAEMALQRSTWAQRSDGIDTLPMAALEKGGLWAQRPDSIDTLPMAALEKEGLWALDGQAGPIGSRQSGTKTDCSSATCVSDTGVFGIGRDLSRSDLQGLSRTVVDSDDEGEERGGRVLATNTEEEEYLALDSLGKLNAVVLELRHTWRYCFWCKFQYHTLGQMELECPGVAEDEHG